MENTTITRAFDFTLETIDFIISQFDQLDEVQRVMGVGRTLEEQSTYDHLRQTLLDASADINRQIEEESKPKYAHRYAILDCEENPIQEYDSLEDAWDVYKEYYETDYMNNYNVSEEDYVLYDNKLDMVVTDRIPYNTYDFEWSLSVNIELEGDEVSTYEAPTYVVENICECFSYGDDNGTYTDEIGDIDWEDIADWEIVNDGTEEVEEATSVSAESTETKEETEPDNTWHIY